MLGLQQIVGAEIRAVEILGEGRPVENTARNVDANPVVQHEAAPQRLAKIRICCGDAQRMCVGEGDGERFASFIVLVNEADRFVELANCDWDALYRACARPSRRVV